LGVVVKCDGTIEDEKHSSNELDPAQVDRYCRHHKFSGWFDTSAKNDINIEESVQFLVGKVRTVSFHFQIHFKTNCYFLFFLNGKKGTSQ
jgi:hypothetical protein